MPDYEPPSCWKFMCGEFEKGRKWNIKMLGITETLDSKANLNLPFRQLLPHTHHIISFAKELKQFVLRIQYCQVLMAGYKF
jgi:hypothetical protein